jgi:hypothetical protein
MKQIQRKNATFFCEVTATEEEKREGRKIARTTSDESDSEPDQYYMSRMFGTTYQFFQVPFSEEIVFIHSCLLCTKKIKAHPFLTLHVGRYRTIHLHMKQHQVWTVEAVLLNDFVCDPWN